MLNPLQSTTVYRRLTTTIAALVSSNFKASTGVRHLSPSPSPPPPLPPLLAEKSGARFGIEKRVIPSGPNPLHN
ncbi:hypothetical protein HYC85_030129 [Camellia sinensis]|uniref:Uncharacterized protein n=1 Tax=Camellia sinensis TaxID=4442 RepID=A0A7J7G2Q3_CAMSI|nr:hypothetical protein HYC85_030129 [Camellia sinensis]